MREQVKQLLKNSVYRALGETARGLGAVNGDERSLRVLMYHKVNDLPGNRMSMPTGLFAEQMAQLRELGYTVVDLDAVLAHYVDGAPLPPGAVLITFDDGYRDNLVNAAPVLHAQGYPAVQFVPIGYVYPSRTPTLRTLTVLLGSLWGVLVFVIVWRLPDPPRATSTRPSST